MFPTPTIKETIKGSLPGYSKQSAMVRASDGRFTLFAGLGDGKLGFLDSTDGGMTWSTPIVFDTIPDGPQLAAAIDSADRVHIIWGLWKAGVVHYGLLDNRKFVMTDTVGAGAFGLNIAVDSANHPHLVWTNLDLFHTTFDGFKWIGPKRVVQGGWHADIKINKDDDIFLFCNDGIFWPTPGANVYDINNVGGRWNHPVKVSSSPFWSGGAAAAIDASGDIYLTWSSATATNGGNSDIYFSRFVDGAWQSPLPIGNAGYGVTEVGQESPAVAIDANNVFYVFWRGYNDKKRPVIFARAVAPENSKVTRVTTGWSPIIQIDDRDASDIWWPSLADVRPKNRVVGVDLVWTATVGKDSVIDYAHVTYP